MMRTAALSTAALLWMAASTSSAAAGDATAALLNAVASAPTVAREEAMALVEAARAEIREGLRQAARREAFLESVVERAELALARRALAERVAERAPAAAWAARVEGPLAADRAVLAAAADRRSRAAEARRAGLALALARTSAAEQEEARRALAAFARSAWADDAAPDLVRASRLAARAARARNAAQGEGPSPPAPRPPAPGDLTLPEGARLAASFRAPDRFGRPSPGVWIALPPGSVLRAPAYASVLAAEPLPHRGMALVLELSPESLLVFVDLDALSVEAGDTLRPGDPAAHVGVRPSVETEFTVEPDAVEGARSFPTFYMEARRGDSPVDPAAWFDALKEAPSR